MGWLDAVPGGRKSGQAQRETRGQNNARFVGEGIQEPYERAELGPVAYMLDALAAAGISRHGGMGEEPLGWPDLAAFAAATGRVSQPWEMEALLAMSRAYLAGRHAGEQPLAAWPGEDGD